MNYFRIDGDLSELMFREYTVTKKKLAANDDLDEDFKVIKDWANGDHDTYMDILKSIALLHLPNTKKPTGIVLAVGDEMSGKTSYLNLIKYLFQGQYIVTKHRVNQLVDYYSTDKWEEFVGDVNLSYLDEYSTIRYPAVFAQILREHLGSTLYGAMFSLPELGTDVPESTADHIIPISFKADLYKKGVYSRDDWTEIYQHSDEELACIYGQTLAVASYYGEKGITFSKRVKKNQRLLKNSIKSFDLYTDELLKYFRGFHNYTFLLDDYHAFCREKNLQPITESEMRSKIKKMGPVRRNHKLMTNPTAKIYKLKYTGDNYYLSQFQWIDKLDCSVEDLCFTNGKREGLHQSRSVVCVLQELQNRGEYHPGI